MLKEPDISTFRLEILRKDRLQELSENFPKADAFQRLCYDLLVKDFKELNSSIRLSPFKTEGPDGAVDISGEDHQHNKLIVECKKNDTPKNAKKELDKLAEKLKENLSEPGVLENSLYSPWFDPRLKKYVYCTSCCFSSDHQRDGFKEEIKKMLLELGALRKELEHLTEVANQGVLLYSWNELKPILTKDRFLHHYWIDQKFIPGVERLSREIDPKRSLRYNDYLSSSKLDYFSRDEYKTQHPEAGDLVTETEILDTLLNQGLYDGCILYGEGGIGKTRLMLELGFRAEEQKWIVFKINDRLSNLEDLEGLFYPGFKYLLLFDYIEESKIFKPDIANWLRDLCPEAMIKILGNCRKTHIEASELLDAEDFFNENLSIKDKVLEKHYEEQVVKHILGDLQRFFRVEKDFYELRPAFAVFLKYLNEKYKTEEEDLDFRNEGAFRLWLKKRLSMTFHTKDYKELAAYKERFYIFFILSSSRDLSLSQVSSTETLCSSLGDEVVLPLLRDGWLEKNEKDELRNIHDTIAEEILILRLQENRDILKTEIKRIFDFACQHDSIKNCFRLFNRVSDWVHDPEEGKPGEKKNSRLIYDLFSKYIMQQPEVCKPLKELLVRTILMDEADIVRLLVEKSAFFEDAIQGLFFGLRLSLKMKHFYKKQKKYESKTFERVTVNINLLLNGWLSANPGFLEHRYISARVIAGFMRLFDVGSVFGNNGEGIEVFASRWMKQFYKTKDASFVIKSWLDAKGEKEIVKDYVVPWLAKYPLEMETHFVIKSWLDVGGDKGQVETYVAPWLEKYPLSMETSFVIKSWLDAKGEKEVVKDYVALWLKKYPLEMETSFVIQSWLDVGGDKGQVETYVAPWLEKYPLSMETSFVIKSWLDAKGEKEVVKDYVAPWLAKYPLSMETSFVIKSWLNAKGEKEVVKDYVAPWLKKFPQEMETHFVIKFWLDAKGEKEVVKDYVAPWLKKFPQEMETHFVIKSWLDAKGEKEVVNDYVALWLEKFPLEKETGFVIKSWLNANGEKKIVKPYVEPWLDFFPLDEENTSFVIRSWLRAGGEPEIVAPFVTRWLEKFCTSFEASYVIKAWLRQTNDVESIKTYAHKWILAFKDHPQADFVIKRFCRLKDIPADVLEAAIHWCKKYASDSEALFTLSYLTRFHMHNEKIAAPWLLKTLSHWISKDKLDESDLTNLETIMFFIPTNETFCNTEECIKLTIHWFLSSHSFSPIKMDKYRHLSQEPRYFERYSRLFFEGRIDVSAHQKKVEKFLKWFNRWEPENKKGIKPHLDELNQTLPQYSHLWQMVEIN